MDADWEHIMFIKNLKIVILYNALLFFIKCPENPVAYQRQFDKEYQITFRVIGTPNMQKLFITYKDAEAFNIELKDIPNPWELSFTNKNDYDVYIYARSPYTIGQEGLLEIQVLVNGVILFREVSSEIYHHVVLARRIDGTPFTYQVTEYY